MSEQSKPARVSRRTVLIGAAEATSFLALTSGSAEAKMALTAVRYQDSPKDSKQCDGCKLFIAPNGCKTVDGAISPQGWCALWVKK